MIIYLYGLALAFALLIGMVLILSAAELAFPREDPMPLKIRFKVIGFAMIFIVFSGVAMRPFWFLRTAPLFPVVVLAVIGSDFIYYWYHRAQHAVPLLWRFHSVHHSIEKMGAGSGYHHLVEATVKGLFVGIPSTALFGSQGLWLGMLATFHGYYLHSTTRISWSPLAWLICDNRVHRIHHSRNPEHFNRNFGVVTLVWDRLFGTAYLPQTDEWPDVGLDDRPEPTSVWEWIVAPLRHISHGLSTHKSATSTSAGVPAGPQRVETTSTAEVDLVL